MSGLEPFLTALSELISGILCNIPKDDDQLIMPIDENLPVYKSSGSLIPYPGDGICPSTAQFENAVKVGYKLWSSLALDTRNDSSLPCTADCLTDLLRHVPAFYAQHLKAFSILNEPFPQVKFA